MAEEFTDDWDKYKVATPTSPAPSSGGDDWDKYVVKKKISPPVAPSTGVQLPNGGTIDQSFQPPTENITPLSPQAHQQQAAQDAQQSAQLQNQLDAYKQAHGGELLPTPEQQPDQIKAYKEPSLGSKAAFELKSIAGSLNKGVANMVIAPLYHYGNKVGLVSDEEKARILNQVADSDKETFGLDPHNLEHGDNVVHNAVNQFAFMAPALITASGTGGASFGLQTTGQAATAVQKMKDAGVKFDNHADDLFILGSGVIGTALGRGTMGNLFNSLGSDAKSNVVSALTADAIKELGEKGTQATADDITKAFLSKANTLADKVSQTGLSALQNYAKVGTEMSAANAATFGTKKLANAVSGNKPFKDTTGEDFVQGVAQPFGLDKNPNGDLGQLAANVLTSPAGVFGAIGGAHTALDMIGDKAPIVESLQKDPSPENIQAIKQQLAQTGQSRGWTPEEVQSASDGVDQLASTVGKLPRNLPPEKMAKGVSLVQGQDALQSQLEQIQADRAKLHPSVANVVSPQEELIQNKIDQANDKLRQLVTGDRATYSKGTEADGTEGEFFKTVNGVKEPITPARYELESMERDVKAGKVEKPEITNKEGENTDATKIEGARTLDVGEPSTNGEAVGEGHTEQIEPTGESQPAISSSENAQPEEEIKTPEQLQADSHNLQTETPTDTELPIKPNEAEISKVPETQAGTEEQPNTETTGQAEPEDGEVKKTILTKRAYEGDIQDEVKKHLEEKGLTRKSFSQEERSKQATDFIDKFGEDAAHEAVKNGDVDGGLAASILAQLQVRNSRAMEELPVGSDERDELAKKQAAIIHTMENKGYLGGEFNGQLAHEYQNAELNYANIKKQVEDATGKPMSAAQDAKVKQLTAENETLKKQAQDAEVKLIEETDKAFNIGKEEGKNESKADKAKRIANKLRSLKINTVNDATLGIPVALYNGAIETSASLIEAGGKLSDAIESGLEHIRNSDWYKGLSDSKKTATENQFKQALNGKSGSTDIEDLQARFVDKKGNKFTPEEARDIWKYMKQTYIENGASYKDALSKTADDLGLSWRQVSEAIITPKLKRVSDEMWKKQSDATRQRSAIKNWVNDQDKSVAGKALSKLSGLFRGVSVFGHGGIFIGTHAGPTLFNPSTWNKVIPAFLNGWKFAYGNEGAYQRKMEELKHEPNYLIAQRAGLKNNPERLNAEEYQKSQKYLGKLGLAGERGFNAIKVLRQGLFDYHYNRLSPADQQDPNVIKTVAHLVNLATGATNLKLPSWVNEVSFAGGMEAARWEKLTASPVKATSTALKALISPKDVTPQERVFAKVWARRVGEQIGTYATLLAANAAIQNQVNPKNPVNMTNPNKPDFLKFKFGDLMVDPTSGMRSTTMFMYKIGQIPFESKKELHGDKGIEALGKDVAKYGRGKLAPLYSTATDFFTGQDYSGNTMPYNKDKPGKYNHHLTWPEYAWSKAPLPVAEAASVAYKGAIDQGANKMTLGHVIDGIMSGGISGTTGFRVSEDDSDKKK